MERPTFEPYGPTPLYREGTSAPRSRGVSLLWNHPTWNLSDSHLHVEVYSYPPNVSFLEGATVHDRYDPIPD